MIAIVCLDDRGGMLFNKRRQSRDREVIRRVLELAEDSVLWIDPFSANLFEEGIPENVRVDERGLDKAGEKELCFVENQELSEVKDRLEALIIFCWNRKYPADRYFKMPRDGWHRVSRRDFSGYSHEKITEVVYRKGKSESTEEGKWV